jgi:putative ABC transport system substrate-binding protein
MRRREFILGLGSAAALSGEARAQQVSVIPRLVFVTNAFPDRPEAQARGRAFREALEKLGWADGRNFRMEDHWGIIPTERLRSVAAELVRSRPAVILASGSAASEALKLESRTVPVVFVAATDPVGSGLVASMARPGGNLTGFTNYDFSIGLKWLDLLKDAAPAVSRVLAIMESSRSRRAIACRRCTLIASPRRPAV